MNNDNEFRPIKKFKCPLTPYQLFTPVATVFLNNLSYEEQILGLYNKLNEIINLYNSLLEYLNQLQDQFNSIVDQVEQNRVDIINLKNQIETLEAQLVNLSNTINNIYLKLTLAINEGDKNTLEEAKKYVDNAINSIGSYGSITAQEYDDLGLTATKYASYQMTALQYDRSAKMILLGLSGDQIQKLNDLPPIKSIGNNLELNANGVLSATGGGGGGGSGVKLLVNNGSSTNFSGQTRELVEALPMEVGHIYKISVGCQIISTGNTGNVNLRLLTGTFPNTNTDYTAPQTIADSSSQLNFYFYQSLFYTGRDEPTQLLLANDGGIQWRHRYCFVTIEDITPNEE